jgi:hypothetical protein
MKLLATLLLAASACFAADQTPPPVVPLSNDPPANPGKIDPALPTIFVAGDSTAARAKAPQQGWAVEFAKYLDLTKVNLSPRARRPQLAHIHHARLVGKAHGRREGGRLGADSVRTQRHQPGE